jgi:hypothetical protein
MEKIVKYLRSNTEGTRVVVVILAILIFGLIFLFLLSWGFNYRFEKTAPIGDTVAGILGTCINAGAALLVYISFMEQVKANREISKQLKDERLFKLFEMYKPSDEIKNISLEFSNYKTDCLTIKKNPELDNSHYANYENLTTKISENKDEFEDLYKVYTTAERYLSETEDNFHSLLIQDRLKLLQPYIWIIRLPSSKADELKDMQLIDEIPILKIQFLDPLTTNTLLTFNKYNSELVKITKLILTDSNGNEIFFSIDLELIGPSKQEFVHNLFDLGEDESINYNVKWEIKYKDKIFNFKNSN